MKRILLLAVLMLGACASEQPTEQAETGAAGGVSVAPEALLATCSDSTYCSTSRASIASYLGGSWSWSTACSSMSWKAQGSGGRTLVANKSSGTPLYAHAVFASQTNVFYNICSCNSNGSVSCSNNPGI